MKTTTQRHKPYPSAYVYLKTKRCQSATSTHHRHISCKRRTVLSSTNTAKAPAFTRGPNLTNRQPQLLSPNPHANYVPSSATQTLHKHQRSPEDRRPPIDDLSRCRQISVQTMYGNSTAQAPTFARRLNTVNQQPQLLKLPSQH